MKKLIFIVAILIAAFQLNVDVAYAGITPDNTGKKFTAENKDGYFKAAVLCTPELRITSPANPNIEGIFAVDLGYFFKGASQVIILNDPSKQLTWTLKGPARKDPTSAKIIYHVWSETNPIFVNNNLLNPRPGLTCEWDILSGDNNGGSYSSGGSDSFDGPYWLITDFNNNCNSLAYFKLSALKVDVRNPDIQPGEYAWKITVHMSVEI